MARKDFTTVPIPNAVLDRVDSFLKTATAISLGIDSRPSFFVMLAAAFLTKYDRKYSSDVKLMDINEPDLIAIYERIKSKSSTD